LERGSGNAAWAGQVENLTADLDADSGGKVLFQLAEGYRAAGRFDLAADTYSQLARRWPDHPLAEPALRWLVQFYSSSEATQRSTDYNAENTRRPKANSAVHQAEHTNPTPAAGKSREERRQVQQANAEAALKADDAPDQTLSRDDRLRRAGVL